jgi:cytochrome b pre-mRNA-processing protein 3
MKAAAALNKVAGRATETYTAYGATELLYKECALQADYSIPQAGKNDQEMLKTEAGEDLGVGEGWWLTGIFMGKQMDLTANTDAAIELGLQPTFSTWSQVTMLHMYLIAARFRCFPTSSQTQTWQQHLLDHFFYDAENRMMVNHNMHARGTRNKYLKDLFIQWRGLLAAYDEGVYKGDAVLAAAIWRNVFKASEDVDIKGLAQIVSYMRRALKGLDSISNERVMGADLQFATPKDEASAVALRSKMMDLPFEKAPGKDLPPGKKA